MKTIVFQFAGILLAGIGYYVLLKEFFWTAS